MSDRGYFTIGELSRRTGVSVRTIRFWSDEGIVPPSARSATGYRLYDTETAARLDLVRTMRELGIDLPTVRKVLDAQTTLAEVAEAHVRALDAEIRALRTRRAVLASVAHRETTTEELRIMNDLARLSAAERRRLIDDFVDSTFKGLDPEGPSAWIATAMRDVPPDLPDDPTREQVDAWMELAGLVADDEFRLRVRQMAVTGVAGAIAGVDAPFNAQGVFPQANAAIEAGVDPASPRAREIVEGLLVRELSADERLRLADEIALFTSRKVERYWELIGILNGQPPFPRAVPAYEWFIAALRETA